MKKAKAVRNWKLKNPNKVRNQKKSSYNQILGCSILEFKSYLEQKFEPGMTWQNQGKWHIDHIKPLSLANSINDIHILNHYINLQPLWASDNLKKKRNKYEG